MTQTLDISAQIQIPLSEFEFSYARSSGPGGQNVNKVNSKAQLRWNVLASPSLPDEVKARLIARLGSRLNDEGEILMTSDRFRDQIRNREDCLEKVRELIVAAAVRPKPRKKTKPSRRAKKKRRESKRRHSEKKSLRRGARYE